MDCKRIIAIANQKGGVGKTTTSINLSAALAGLGKRVLLVDMDPQGNASSGVGIDISLVSKNIYNVLNSNYNINKAIKKTLVKGLDVIPSNIKLAMLDGSNLKSGEDKFSILKKALNCIEKDYDYVIIDCPPSLGLLNINSLVAAKSVLIPIQCEYFAMEGVSQILSSISRIQNEYNNSLKIEGFLFTMYDPRTCLATEVTTQIRGLFKENTFITTISRNISLPESNAKGVPVTILKPKSTGSLNYISLAKEVIQNESKC